MNIKTKLAALATTLVALIAPLATTPAHAAPANNMVVFGDSFAANPCLLYTSDAADE